MWHPQEFTKADLQKKSKEERQEAAKEFMEHGVDFGPLWQTEWLVVTCRDHILTDPALLATFLHPVATKEAWSPDKPVLGNSKLRSREVAKTLIRIVFNEVVLALMKDGIAKVELLKTFLASLKPIVSMKVDDLVLQEALGVVAEVVAFFDTLMGSNDQNVVETLDSVMECKQGALSMGKKAVKQHSYYKGLEMRLRKSAAALASMGPEVQAAQLLFQTGEKDQWPGLIRKIPAWLDSLPATCTEGLLKDMDVAYLAFKKESIEAIKKSNHSKSFDLCLEVTTVLSETFPKRIAYAESLASLRTLQGERKLEARLSAGRECLQACIHEERASRTLSFIFTHKQACFSTST